MHTLAKDAHKYVIAVEGCNHTLYRPEIRKQDSATPVDTITAHFIEDR